MSRPRPRLVMVIAAALVVGLVLAAGAAWWATRAGDDYDHSLQRYGDRGEANRYVNLPDGDAQLAYGSPDGHRLVVQWRDPDGHGWTAPETLYESRLTAVDSVIRYAGGTVAIVETYTPDTSNDQDDDNVNVVMVCHDRTCTPGRTGPGYTSDEPQLTPDGDTVLLGQTRRNAKVWTRQDGYVAWPWSGLPTGTASTADPLLAPDGSLRVVTSRPSRGTCTFSLLASTPGSADLDAVARTTEPLRGRGPSDCHSYLDTFSADWVSTHPDDHRAADFWFVRDGDDWTATRSDPSGLVALDVPRGGCCGLAVAGFIHWNDLAFGSPDGHRISVQPHFQGAESWEPRQLLDGAPAGYRCTWIDGHEVDDGVALLLTCHSGAFTRKNQFRGDAYALAVTTDLRHWESTFVSDVRRDPVLDDEGVTIVGTPRLRWTPETGLDVG